ncbi:MULTISPECIES: sugar phosphate isomerase/epimerase family protein [Streptomyces]|uniref:sugar phosphate isomerase/epimerase family protein n=1 Tax=Streptomyces TaxID=1883 RepID=UPI00137063DC|nr:TIM barrel protein [Streptomyces sp. SID2888]MYV45434.1 TIM barrel protein [Streptomyces sp. SID2888]
MGSADRDPAASGPVPGLVSVTFRALPVEKVVEVAAEAGLGAVEWGGDVHVPVGASVVAEQTRARCADAGLEIVSYGSYHRAGTTPAARFAAVVDTAVALGAPAVRIWAGTSGSAETSPPERAAVVDGIRRAADRAAEQGLRIALEYHRNTLTDTLESALRLLDEVDRGNVVPYWQPTRGAEAAASRAEVAALLGRGLGTVHVFSWAADGTRLPLRDREDLWRPVLADLAAAGGRRYLLLEFVADDDPAVFARDAAVLHSWLATTAR